MPRPQKWRKVCAVPAYDSFGPLRNAGNESPLIMTIDEYETIRLIDLEGLTQQQCAERMNVARTTVQGIYDAARGKIADALVNGKMMKIAGGRYQLCEGTYRYCQHQGCRHKHRGCGVSE